MSGTRWEQGSELEWMQLDPPEPDDPEQAFLRSVAPLRFGSGRAALLGLLESIGRPRIWLPSYFCEDVVVALSSAGLRVARYRDLPIEPLEDPDDAQPGDAVLRVNGFGVRAARSARSLRERGCVVIEDHTHDPTGSWARGSNADWCVASLRKTLPLPDGALLWSPRGHQGPREPELVDRMDARKLAAMLLKRMYLDGHPIEKAEFRALAIAGEAEIDRVAGFGGPSGPQGISRLSAALIPCMPLVARRAARERNLAALAEALVGAPGIELFLGGFAILVCDTAARRERLRLGLIERRIFPAVLWPQVAGAAEMDLSERVLAIHADARYGPDDMQRVAASVRSLVSG